jgi:hypothetical protein
MAANGMTVPDYQESVAPETGIVPKVALPQVVPDAFGANVGEAVAGLGQKVEGAADQLQNHIIERVNQEKEMAVYQGEMQLRDTANKFLFGNDMVTKKINGVDTPVPQGIVNRQGALAQGSYQDFTDNYNKASDAFVNSFPSAQQKRLASYLSQRNFGYYSELASRHEATQYRKNYNDTMTASMQGDMDIAKNALTVDDVKSSLNNVVPKAQALNRFNGVDQNDKVDSIKGNVIQSAILGQLTQGNVDNAYGILNNLKDQVSPKEFERLQGITDKSVKALQTQNKIQSDQSMVSNRIGALNGIATGEINWQNAPDMVSKIAPHDPELATAIQKVVDSKYDFTADTDPSKGAAAEVPFQSMLKNMVNSSDQKGLTDMMIKDLGQTAGKISPTRLALYVQASIDRAKSLPLRDGDGAPVNYQQRQTDAGLKALMNWSTNSNAKTDQIYDSYLTDIKNKVDPTAAYNRAISTALMSSYPETAMMPDKPNVAVNGSNGMQFISGDTSKVKADYHIQDGMIVPKSAGKPKDRGEGRYMQDAHGNRAIVYKDGSFSEIPKMDQGEEEKSEPSQSDQPEEQDNQPQE